jgi:hypothetical protein
MAAAQYSVGVLERRQGTTESGTFQTLLFLTFLVAELSREIAAFPSFDTIPVGGEPTRGAYTTSPEK